MIVYLDSSALVKLVREEHETGALLAWLDERSGEPQVTSQLARTEVARALRRAAHDERAADERDGRDSEDVLAELLAEGEAVVAGVGQLPVLEDLLDEAGTLAAPTLRTLDAIHLASARTLRPAAVDFVTYDSRLAAAARDDGFVVAAPGGP